MAGLNLITGQYVIGIISRKIYIADKYKGGSLLSLKDMISGEDFTGSTDFLRPYFLQIGDRVMMDDLNTYEMLYMQYSQVRKEFLIKLTGVNTPKDVYISLDDIVEYFSKFN